jgi:hypothetical protein
MRQALGPLGDDIHQMLGVLSRATAVDEGQLQSTKQTLRELASAVAQIGPIGVGRDTLIDDDRAVFRLWEQAMATALGLNREDAFRVAGAVAGARVSRASVEEWPDFRQFLHMAADAWHLLGVADRKEVLVATRRGVHAHMLGFANSFVQNEMEQLPADWRELLWALGRCVVQRVSDEWDELRSSTSAWKRILDPFSEQSMFGARVLAEASAQRIVNVLQSVSASVRRQ